MKPSDAAEFDWRAIIDQVVSEAYANNDQFLINGIRTMDKQAQDRGVSFYDVMFEMFLRQETETKAKDWLAAQLRAGPTKCVECGIPCGLVLCKNCEKNKKLKSPYEDRLQ